MAAKTYNILAIGVIIAVLLYFYLAPFKVPESFVDTETYTAVMIEPRAHKAFEFVMDNFLTNLDTKWNFIVFHGTENENYVKDILKTKFANQSSRITTMSLGVPNLSLDEYSAYMMKRDFLDKIPTEVFLLFQTDSMICPSFKDKINMFIQYDYVGAPWAWSHPPWRQPKKNPTSEDGVGNGGLSLRRKTKMLEIIEKCPVQKPEPEDTFFALPCDAVKINKPSSELAKEFSMEGVYSENSFGLHKTWVPWHLGESYNQQINNWCEGYNTLVDLNR